MKKHYLVYRDTGEIVRAGSCPDVQFELQVPQEDDSLFLLEGQGSPSMNYVENGEIKEKTLPELTVVVSGLDATISGLPDVCDLSTEGQEYSVVGPDVTLSFDKPGTYVVFVRATVKHLKTTVEVVIE